MLGNKHKFVEMKNLLIYYLAILVPVPLLVWAVLECTPVVFVALLIAYLLYRGLIDSYRLLSLNIIEREQFWRYTLIPFYTSKYFFELYFLTKPRS